MYSARYSCQILTKLEFSRQIFEKCANMSKVKLQITLEQTTKTQRWSRGTAVLFL